MIRLHVEVTAAGVAQPGNSRSFQLYLMQQSAFQIIWKIKNL